VEKAVWESSGTLRFTGHYENSAAGIVAVSASTDAVEVPAVTLDEAVAGLGLDRVDFIKMDIEGAERQALKGARATLTRFAPRMAICTYHRKDDGSVLPQTILATRASYRVLKRGRFQAYFY
jgi:FkbM family methyltransferase